MSQLPQWGGEAEMTAQEPVMARAQAEPEKYVKVQDTAPMLAGLKRAGVQALFGAVGGLLIGMQMGSRDWPDLLWGALIGACTGFAARGGEGGMDQLTTAKGRPDQTVGEVEDHARRYVR